MNSAKLRSSPRLQRTLQVLQNAEKPLTTLELMTRARIVAVSSVVAELRDNGAGITCSRQFKKGQPLFYYVLTKSPKGYAQ